MSSDLSYGDTFVRRVNNLADDDEYQEKIVHR